MEVSSGDDVNRFDAILHVSSHEDEILRPHPDIGTVVALFSGDPEIDLFPAENRDVNRSSEHEVIEDHFVEHSAVVRYDRLSRLSRDVDATDVTALQSRDVGKHLRRRSVGGAPLVAGTTADEQEKRRQEQETTHECLHKAGF